MSDIERVGDVPTARSDFGPAMAEVRRRLQAGEVPDPVEGEVVDRCPVCDAPSTYTQTAIGWRIRAASHIKAIHDGKASTNLELELQPPSRTQGDDDE